MKTNFELTYRRPLALAIAFHLILLMLFLFRFHFDNTSNSSPAPADIVQATLVTSSEVTQPPAPTSLPPVEKETIAPPKEKPIIVEKPPSPPPVEKAVIQEKTLDHAEMPKEDIAAMIETETDKNLLVKKKEEAKKVEIEKQQQLAKEKQQKLQAEIEQQMEKEQQQKKAQALAKKRQREIEQLLQQDLVESTPTKSSGRSAEKMTKSTSISSGIDNKAMDHYKGLIISAISHRWIVPENLKKGIECRLKVQVAPGGVVMNVKLIKSSGESALDHSAETAVYKASPLPVPKDAALFNNFREFNLTVKPEGILAE